MLNIIVASDLHFGIEDKKFIDRQNHIINFVNQNYKSSADENIFIIPGDMTDHGYDGNYSIGKLKCNCISSVLSKSLSEKILNGGRRNELSMLKSALKLVNPKYKIIMCLGNHDIPYNDNVRNPVGDYIKSLYGDSKYVYKIEKHDLYIMVCDVFPNKKTRTWMSNELAKISNTSKIILVMHYNLTEFHSEWWSETEKNEFYNVIKNHKIIAIFNGHSHISTRSEFHGINVYTCGDLPVFNGLFINGYLLG